MLIIHGHFLSVVNNGPNFTSQRIDIITNKNTASYKRSWYYGNDTDYPGWSPWILDMSNADIPYRLSLESDKKYLVIYDNKTNAKLAHINTDAQF